MNNFEYKSATTSAGIFLNPFHSWTLAGSSGDDQQGNANVGAQKGGFCIIFSSSFFLKSKRGLTQVLEQPFICLEQMVSLLFTMNHSGQYKFIAYDLSLQCSQILNSTICRIEIESFWVRTETIRFRFGPNRYQIVLV